MKRRGSQRIQTPVVHERMAARIKAVRHRPWLVWGIAAGSAALIAAMVWLIGFSSVLAVKEVRVHGGPAYLREEAELAADVPYGRPLARVDTDAIARRVRDTHQFAAVDVSRGWPGSVDIRIVPKTPRLAWKNAQGEVEVIDDTGMRYRVVQRRPERVPLVSTAASEPGPAELRGVVDMVRARPSAMRGELNGIVVTDTREIRFRLDKRQVIWGSGADSAKKWAVLDVLLRQEDVADSDSPINVTSPDNPVLLP